MSSHQHAVPLSREILRQPPRFFEWALGKVVLGMFPTPCETAVRKRGLAVSTDEDALVDDEHKSR
jgi:hypothetical protein